MRHAPDDRGPAERAVVSRRGGTKFDGPGERHQADDCRQGRALRARRISRASGTEVVAAS